MNSDEIRDKLRKLNPKALLPADLDDALVGIAFVHSRYLAIYDTQAIVDVLRKRDGMDFDDAEEFFFVNIAGAYVGPNTPIFHTFQWPVVPPEETTSAAGNPPEVVA